MDDTALAHALQLREMGISTIPLAPGEKKPPRGFLWKEFQDRMPTEDEIRNWHDRNGFGLAVVCGEVSGGLIVRDFDQPGAYERFRDRHPELCLSLPAVCTARGMHLWARCRFTEHFDLADGELRGDRHYTACPPTIHPSGLAYGWVRPPWSGIPRIDDPEVFIGGARRKRTESPSRSPHLPCGEMSPKKDINQPPPLSLCLTGGVEAAIRATLPRRYGTRHWCLLALCRLLRGLFPDASVADVELYVREWHRQALPTIKTKEYGRSWAEFRPAWRTLRRGGGGPTWADALVAAGTVGLPGWAERYDNRHRDLILLAAGLNQVHGGASFPLACRQVRTVIPVSTATAARMLSRLVADRVLTVTSDDVEIGRKAYEYRYTGMVRKGER